MYVFDTDHWAFVNLLLLQLWICRCVSLGGLEALPMFLFFVSLKTLWGGKKNFFLCACAYAGRVCLQ